MFQKTRSQLILAYVAVLTVILSVFTIAVRFTFTRSLNQQLNLRLSNLAKAAAFNMDNEDGELETDEDEILVGQAQAIEWFDLEGERVGQQGEYELDFPLDIEQLSESQNHPDSIRSVAIPVYSLEDETELIGYVRVSQSLTELDNTLRRLDYGLGSGIAISLLLSGVGSIWLTRRAMQPIEESFARLKQFTADASHELRSPLMAIRTNADVALKYPEGMRDTDAEKLTAISSASDQMTRLTENLLLLARSDRVSKLQTKVINLRLILSDLIQLHKSQIEEKKLTYRQQLEADLFVLGDEILLKQLFNNLLQNAIHYTATDGVITLEAQKNNQNSITVKVRDTGIGIAPEHLDQIFERFWRVDKSRSYQTGKSGLGLAIVREIIQLHRGNIFVESQLGIGSCFIVHLPVKVSQY
ncbi:Histidine kinase [Hyella patelloides LEGE 07179]|uniref:histidine kinase n=1 Tax=Hyella patelloides LEGE 07179 TaxID=945734 RepID=A0A563VSU4_9CYAN|nr:ATP-binding protein [Hyella patelloides]VEP14481.1 Histidine kinase [Hyella patelloides LEGE 07179]